MKNKMFHLCFTQNIILIHQNPLFTKNYKETGRKKRKFLCKPCVNQDNFFNKTAVMINADMKRIFSSFQVK